MTRSLAQISAGITGGLPPINYGTSKDDPVDKALAGAEPHKHKKSFLESLVSGAAKTVGKVADIADTGRAAFVSSGVELGDLVGDVIGKDTGSNASWHDLLQQTKDNIGAGDVLEYKLPGLPLNVKRALGLALDVASDPLNAATLGSGAAVRGAARTVGMAAGDDVARTVLREGVEAADKQIIREAAVKNGIGGLGGVIPPSPRSVAEILTDAAKNPEAAQKLLGKVDARAGQTLGIGGRTVISKTGRLEGVGEVLGDAGRWAKGTEVGRGVRAGLVPFSAARDRFGNAFADTLAQIGHRREAAVGRALEDFDNLVRDYTKKGALPDNEQAIIRRALETPGGVPETLASQGTIAGHGLSDRGAELLRRLDTKRGQAYDLLVASGVSPDDMLPKEEYLRHVLTPEAAEALGIPANELTRGNGATGLMKQRRFEGGVDWQNEIMQPQTVTDRSTLDKILKRPGTTREVQRLVDDPARLSRSSYRVAQKVGGNKAAFDELAAVAEAAGHDVTSAVPKAAEDGRAFVRVAPDAFVHPDVAKDLFNVQRSGFDNKAIQAWDAFTGTVKRHTLFNVIAFGPYVAQNAATGIAMNTADGVLPRYYKWAGRLHKAASEASEIALKAGEGEDGFEKALRTVLPDAADRDMVHALRKEGIFAPGHSVYDDVASEAPLALDDTKFSKALRFGTNTTEKANNYLEEMLRGSSFLKHMEDGLSSDAAAKTVLSRHLDYTALGRTAFERNNVNRFIFFPTWLMRAPGAIGKLYAEHPGLLNAELRLEQGGKSWDRKTNDFGEPIGPRLSGPASFLFGLHNDVIKAPGELLNPAIRFAINGGGGATELLPPLSNVMGNGPTQGRAQGVIENDAKRSKYLRSLGGVRTGTDYGAEHGKEQLQADIAERKAGWKDTVAGRAGKPYPGPTAVQALKLYAGKRGIEDAYELSKSQLTAALLKDGVSRRKLRELLTGES